MTELIVTFHRGVTEDEARTIVDGLGLTIRRRLRSEAERVVLLVRANAEHHEAALASNARVESVEPNLGGFHIS